MNPTTTGPARSPARDTVRDMWDSRPVRPRDDRKLAGVASAIARRYELDPTLVRIGFVVAALVGPGLGLYVAGCAVLPDAGPPGAPPRRSGPASALSVLLLILAGLLLVASLWSSYGVIALLVTVGLLAALHLTRGNRPGGRAAARSATPLPPWQTGPAPTPAPYVSSAGLPGRQQPPAWDPLGAAPFAWDLPEPGPEPGAVPAGRRRTSKLTPVTLAVALIVAGMTGVVLLAAPGALPASAVPGAALVVVGAGLVIGAFRRAGRWLIPFAVLLALVTAVTGAAEGAVGPDGWATRDGVGSVTEAPASVAALRPEYRVGTGTVDLDLSGLDLTAAPGADGPVRTAATAGVGGVSVTVPEDADVVVHGSTGMGDVSVDGRSESGRDARLDVTDPGPDGPGGRVLELNLRSETGYVEVHRD
ncbi:PspC domain-containing protein [Pseudonocardia phyllosphaerae]|uniref:PspC domain-containing protein n=1 Tax=Pseudonocardia phyllosphaerae TaxID=3390502 RepID=UPI00397E6DF7